MPPVGRTELYRAAVPVRGSGGELLGVLGASCLRAGKVRQRQLLAALRAAAVD